MALINYLNRVHLAPGALKQLPNELATLKITRPMVVTDPGLAGSEVLQRLLAQCPAHTVVFADTPQNPTEDAVEAAVRQYLASGCDGLVAFGGGSPMDLAKATAVLATHEGPLSQYTVVEGGEARILPTASPIIAVPTTAGTGSEVGRSAMISMRSGGKRSVRSFHLVPRVAICDAELTLGLPARLTAATGMDALTHCFETYLSPVDNPVAEAIALHGAQLAYSNIEAVTLGDTTNIEARHNMMTAALMGGLAFQKGLGAVHALAHQLGALKEPLLHHGTLNAVLLPAVLRYNREYIASRSQALARALGLPEGQDLAEAVEQLNVRLGLPLRLSEMGVPADCLAAMAEAAPGDPSTRTNPRPVDVAGYRSILEDAF
ncbi:iron-containing alcohol dehydrogenase [Ottowia thiooxydans]|uniref:iron-containing alcohol dehydrogenase n=1 Tax=Ottowia thiooxydans TaxID=219182 RepID=UPI0004047A8B|nr:iron-containing alcohol dehydrogenase [Ottowia thiooxydans]